MIDSAYHISDSLQAIDAATAALESLGSAAGPVGDDTLNLFTSNGMTLVCHNPVAELYGRITSILYIIWVAIASFTFFRWLGKSYLGGFSIAAVFIIVYQLALRANPYSEIVDLTLILLPTIVLASVVFYFFQKSTLVKLHASNLRLWSMAAFGILSSAISLGFHIGILLLIRELIL